MNPLMAFQYLSLSWGDMKSKNLLIPFMLLNASFAIADSGLSSNAPFNVVIGANPPAPPSPAQYGLKSSTAQQAQMNTVSQERVLNISPAAKQAIDQLNLMTPDELRYLQHVNQRTQKARAEQFRALKKRNRNLIYGSNKDSDKAVYIFKGYTTSLVFVDSEGNPWPATSYKAGNEEAYKVEGHQEKESAHIVTISLRKEYLPSNLTVILENNPIPIVIDLDSDGEVLDRMVTVSVGGASPTLVEEKGFDLTSMPSITQNNIDLAPFLDNTPPDGARIVSVFGEDNTSVWFWDNRFICRTNSQLINPVPLKEHGKMSSFDGQWTVYDLGATVPPIFSFLNGYGEFVRATVAIDEVTP